MISTFEIWGRFWIYFNLIIKNGKHLKMVFHSHGTHKAEHLKIIINIWLSYIIVYQLYFRLFDIFYLLIYAIWQVWFVLFVYLTCFFFSKKPIYTVVCSLIKPITIYILEQNKKTSRFAYYLIKISFQLMTDSV